MSNEDILLTIQIILAVVQVLAFVGLIFTIWKTWEMASATRISALATRDAADATKLSAETAVAALEEMKISRNEESAPYVVMYFDIPYGTSEIYLVIKNVGKSPADNIKIELTPELIDSHGRNWNEVPMIKNGIASIPPDYEIRTFMDSSIGFFGDTPRPQTYKAQLTYSSSLFPVMRTSTQVLDLSVYEGLMFGHVPDLGDVAKGIKDLVGTNKKLVDELQDLAGTVKRGIYVRNPDFLISNQSVAHSTWEQALRAKLVELKLIWQSKDGLLIGNQSGRAFRDFKTRLLVITSQLFVICSNLDSNLAEQLESKLVPLIVKLREIDSAYLFITLRSDDENIEELNELGRGLTALLNDMLAALADSASDSQSTAPSTTTP